MLHCHSEVLFTKRFELYILLLGVRSAEMILLSSHSVTSAAIRLFSTIKSRILQVPVLLWGLTGLLEHVSIIRSYMHIDCISYVVNITIQRSRTHIERVHVDVTYTFFLSPLKL